MALLLVSLSPLSGDNNPSCRTLKVRGVGWMDQLPGHRGLNLKGDDDDCWAL